MTQTNRELAAIARRDAGSGMSRGAATKPAQRRSSIEPHATTRAPLPPISMEIRGAIGGSGPIGFHGLASATGQGYEMWDMFGEYTEQVLPGAFTKTLNQADLDVPLVLAHDSLRRIASTLSEACPLILAEIDEGLDVDAPTLDPTDPDVQLIVPKISNGLIREMSFRFVITAGEWSPDWMQYNIQEVDIQRGDVAIVGYGANPFTSASMRDKTPSLEELIRADPATAFEIARAQMEARGQRPPMTFAEAMRN